MRLWHKDLICVLPRQQLLGQWRELCLIAKNIKEKGTPNHILVNPVMDYPLDHFISYQFYVAGEMTNRGYAPNDEHFYKYISPDKYSLIPLDQLFRGWHNDDYLRQCYYNLQEKYMRHGIAEDEWYAVCARCREVTK